MILTADDGCSKISLDSSELSPVEWLDETAVDDSAPKYLVPTQRRRGQFNSTEFSGLLV
jgi:serine/threonine-protein kinase SRPK3